MSPNIQIGLNRPLIFALLFAMIFVWSVHYDTRELKRPVTFSGQVVIAAPVQLLMYAGDRFLGANLEAIRAATVTLDDLNDRDRADYRLRTHRVVTQLNPCHEDNYYMGNAVLTWGGMQDEGNDLLKRATECRFWDELPPFFLGFNQYFFFRDTEHARQNLEIAAERATDNAAALRKLAVMITAEQMDDEQMAVSYLRQQVRDAQEPKLRAMLEKRLLRLEGLLALRQAQQRFETEMGQPLESPEQLISLGFIEQFPQDPLRLGYEFIDGVFRLRTIQIQGLKNDQ